MHTRIKKQTPFSDIIAIEQITIGLAFIGDSLIYLFQLWVIISSEVAGILLVRIPLLPNPCTPISRCSQLRSSTWLPRHPPPQLPPFIPCLSLHQSGSIPPQPRPRSFSHNRWRRLYVQACHRHSRSSRHKLRRKSCQHFPPTFRLTCQEVTQQLITSPLFPN